MSRCWFKPASAVPRRGGINTVDPLPTYFGTGVDVRGASPAAGRPITLQRHKFFRMHTYKKRACKFFGMHCYKIIGLKVPWNEHLQKKGVGGLGASRQIRTASVFCPAKLRDAQGFLLRTRLATLAVDLGWLMTGAKTGALEGAQR